MNYKSQTESSNKEEPPDNVFFNKDEERGEGFLDLEEDIGGFSSDNSDSESEEETKKEYKEMLPTSYTGNLEVKKYEKKNITL